MLISIFSWTCLFKAVCGDFDPAAGGSWAVNLELASHLSTILVFSVVRDEGMECNLYFHLGMTRRYCITMNTRNYCWDC